MKIRGTKVNGFSDVRLGKWIFRCAAGMEGSWNGCFEVVGLSHWMAM
jgi:hypothetical protein